MTDLFGRLRGCATLIPRPPHLALPILYRPSRQKLPHHRRMPVLRSPMQRRASILRRAVALRQQPSPAAQLRAPHPAPATLSITKSEGGGGRDGTRQLACRETTMPGKFGVGSAMMATTEAFL